MDNLPNCVNEDSHMRKRQYDNSKYEPSLKRDSISNRLGEKVNSEYSKFIHDGSSSRCTDIDYGNSERIMKRIAKFGPLKRRG